MRDIAKRLVTVVGGLTITAFLLMLAAPKTAHAIVSTLVTVANTAANPVPTVATDNPARQAVELQAIVTVVDGEFYDSAYFESFGTTSPYTVPAGQRLVVESVTGSIGVPSGQTPLATQIYLGNGVEMFPAASFQGTSDGVNSYSFATQYTTYMSPGVQAQVTLNRSINSGQALGTYYLAGHLENIQ
jgi:hypothetical protein